MNRMARVDESNTDLGQQMTDVTIRVSLLGLYVKNKIHAKRYGGSLFG